MGALKWLDLHFLLSGDYSGLSVRVEGAEPSWKTESSVGTNEVVSRTKVLRGGLT